MDIQSFELIISNSFQYTVIIITISKAIHSLLAEMTLNVAESESGNEDISQDKVDIGNWFKSNKNQTMESFMKKTRGRKAFV